MGMGRSPKPGLTSYESRECRLMCIDAVRSLVEQAIIPCGLSSQIKRYK